MTASSLEEIIQNFNGMVAADGGRVSLVGEAPSDGELRVRYDMGDDSSDDCATCTITPDMLEVFLQESLHTHGIAVDRVVVETSTR